MRPKQHTFAIYCFCTGIFREDNVSLYTIDRDYFYFSYFLKFLYSFSKSSDIENLNSAMLEKSL